MSAINYSIDRLHAEYASREVVRSTLRHFKEKYNITGKSIVELGSGLGFNLEQFSGDNQVVGVEGLPDAAARARLRGVHTIVSDLSCAVPLNSAEYDVAICLDVLEHLLQPERCLREAARLLKTNGLLIVNVPNHFTLTGRLNILRGIGIDSVRFFPESDDWNNPHVRFFRHHSIAALLRSSGFSIVEDWSSMFPSYPLIWRYEWINTTRLSRSIARRFPSLFAGGFFLIASNSG